MPELTEQEREAFLGASGHRRFEVTIYSGGLKVVGVVYYSADTRTSSRRASDFIQSLTQERVTLSQPRIYERATNLVIDEPPFAVIMMNRVDTMYATEIEPTTPAE